jgi:hypothetical protein
MTGWLPSTARRPRSSTRSCSLSTPPLGARGERGTVRAQRDGVAADLTELVPMVAALVAPMRRYVQQIVGDEAVAELVVAFAMGVTREELADRYGVSLSSVKPLPNGSNVRRR